MKSKEKEKEDEAHINSKKEKHKFFLSFIHDQRAVFCKFHAWSDANSLIRNPQISFVTIVKSSQPVTKLK
jgi:hypothetical protein